MTSQTKAQQRQKAPVQSEPPHPTPLTILLPASISHLCDCHPCCLKTTLQSNSNLNLQFFPWISTLAILFMKLSTSICVGSLFPTT